MWTQRLVFWGALFVIWEGLTFDFFGIFGPIISPFFLPSFSQVVMAMFAAFPAGDMTILGGSLGQMFTGFGLAALVGVPVGLLMGASKIVDWVLSIYVNALFVTSMEALLPFIIILVGTEFKFRVVVVFLFALFFIIINTAAGVRAVSSDLLETADAFCTSPLGLFVKVITPAALPYIIAGLRLGLGHAVKGMVIAELWVIVATGKRLVDLGFARKLPEYFALALWIVLFGAVTNQLMLMLQRKITPWGSDIAVMGLDRK